MIKITNELFIKLYDVFLFVKPIAVKFIMRHGIDKKFMKMYSFDSSSPRYKIVELFSEKLIFSSGLFL